MVIIFFVLWLNPIKGIFHRKLRFGALITLFNVIIAPLGNVNFRTYLLAEVLTDCSITIGDAGRTAMYFSVAEADSSGWHEFGVKLSAEVYGRVPVVKWIWYCLTFLPYMWRMNQNLKKWLVYNHRLQAFNALKYFMFIVPQICAIIYYEAHISAFKYLYYSLKIIACAYKYFWDVYYDWGLFHSKAPKSVAGYSSEMGTSSGGAGNGYSDGWPFLRSQIKYSPWFYYISMVYDLVGLYSWAISLLISSLIQPDPAQDHARYHRNLIWITWLELLVVFVRRTVWVIIRVESEFFNNFEQYRDIVTIPPIQFEE